ncbi:MAG: hypothetical protein JRG70_09055 [Deltaproteobacteria bacterium]|nr:hypothetical protein [Deltaproteobacteria bacterium]
MPYTIELKNENIDQDIIACRLEITFDVPLYMTQGETGGLLNLGDDGLPEQNGTFEYRAAMIVPVSAQAEPASLVEFGHGQLGAKEQVLGFQEIAAQGNFATFGLDWKGFSHDDVPTVIAAIISGDLSTFRAIPERMHQGFLNFLIAMRTLSREAEGGPSTIFNQALTNDCGGATVDGSKRYYFGGSQGGILGASLMAINTDIERGLLAVPGQSYNLLLNRSVNFDEFATAFYGNYDWNALDTQMNLALIQGLWDRAEPTGYSKYVRTNLLPGTPPHEVLIQVSKADHQVTNLGAHIMARTIGGVVNLAPLIREVWGIEVVNRVHVGSAMIEVDFGNPDAPITNIPHWADTMQDPHGRATELTATSRPLRSRSACGAQLDPAEHSAEHDQADGVEGEDHADGCGLPLDAFHVVHPVGDDQEREVAEQEDQPGRGAIPPRVIPGQGVDGVEAILDEDRERAEEDRKDPTVGQAEDLRFLGGEHDGRHDSEDREHETDLDVESDQNQVRGFARRRPCGRVATEVEDQRVPNLVEPIHAP